MPKPLIALILASVALIALAATTSPAKPVNSQVISSAAPNVVLVTDTLSILPDKRDCVDHVAKLPKSNLYKRSDRRLGQRDLVVVLKSARRLMLFRRGKAVKNNKAKGCWQVGLGGGKIAGTKHREGDMKTPEGWYRTSDKPWSKFHGAIAIHYPNRVDARRGLRNGLITRRTYKRITRALSRGLKPPQHTRLGGEVLIHGGGGGSDWTLGCVALDNHHLDELRAALPKNKRIDVLILP